MIYQDRNSPKDLHHLLFSRYTFVTYLQLYLELSSVGLIILCFASTTKSESLITATSQQVKEEQNVGEAKNSRPKEFLTEELTTNLFAALLYCILCSPSPQSVQTRFSDSRHVNARVISLYKSVTYCGCYTLCPLMT